MGYRHHRGNCISVFPLRRTPLTRGGFRGPQALASSHPHSGFYLRRLPDHRYRTLPTSAPGGPQPVCRLFVPLPRAVDGPVLGGIHLRCQRKRGGRHRQRVDVESVRRRNHTCSRDVLHVGFRFPRIRQRVYRRCAAATCPIHSWPDCTFVASDRENVGKPGDEECGPAIHRFRGIRGVLGGNRIGRVDVDCVVAAGDRRPTVPYFGRADAMVDLDRRESFRLRLRRPRGHSILRD